MPISSSFAPRLAVAGLGVSSLGGDELQSNEGASTSMLSMEPPRIRQLSLAPALPEQEVRVLFATLLPGDTTPYHSHRFPVTVYVTEGTFSLELDDRDPVAIQAGQVFVEPAGVAMTGRNQGEVPARMALFYVCEPGVPFADPFPKPAIPPDAAR